MSNINCQHSPLSQLDARQEHEHFDECLSLDVQREQLVQWRDAARKWWDHQEHMIQQGLDIPVEMPPEAEPPHDASVNCIEVNPSDMRVHVVLRGNALTLADREPLDPAVLETITPTERAVARALLFCAVNELED